MTFAPDKDSFYDFTIDIYLIKEAIEGKDKTISKVYNKALEEIGPYINRKISAYQISSRTFDLVTLAAKNYSDEFKDGEANLKTLLKIMEENNKKQKFFL